MRGLLIDGPNRGLIVNTNRPGTVFKVIDPSEHALSYKVDDSDPLRPIKVNTYYRMPAHPFARAYGFDFLWRFQSTNVMR